VAYTIAMLVLPEVASRGPLLFPTSSAYYAHAVDSVSACRLETRNNPEVVCFTTASSIGRVRTLLLLKTETAGTMRAIATDPCWLIMILGSGCRKVFDSLKELCKQRCHEGAITHRVATGYGSARLNHTKLVD
jgi:hypothetical protein